MTSPDDDNHPFLSADDQSRLPAVKSSSAVNELNMLKSRFREEIVPSSGASSGTASYTDNVECRSEKIKSLSADEAQQLQRNVERYIDLLIGQRKAQEAAAVKAKQAAQRQSEQIARAQALVDGLADSALLDPTRRDSFPQDEDQEQNAQLETVPLQAESTSSPSQPTLAEKFVATFNVVYNTKIDLHPVLKCGNSSLFASPIDSDPAKAINNLRTDSREIFYPTRLSQPENTQAAVAVLVALVFLGVVAYALDLGLSGGFGPFVPAYTHIVSNAATLGTWVSSGSDTGIQVARGAAVAAGSAAVAAAGIGLNYKGAMCFSDPVNDLTSTMHAQLPKPEPAVVVNTTRRSD